MLTKYYIKSKSQIRDNEIFSLDHFKKPFCYNETKKKYKIYQYPNFKYGEFWKIKYKNKNPILVVSGPARNGNHLVISLLDGHSQIRPHPGEDDFLRSFFSFINLNEKGTIKKIKSKNHKFLHQLSGQPNFLNKKKKVLINGKDYLNSITKKKNLQYGQEINLKMRAIFKTIKILFPILII